MRIFLAIITLGLLLDNNLYSKMTLKEVLEDYETRIKKMRKENNEKSLSCKKEIKDISGANAVEAYEKCMKKR